VGGAARDRGKTPRRQRRARPRAGAGGAEPGDIVVRDGTPPQPQAATAGHFLDRAL